MSELPDGWVLATVHELAETSLGKMLDAKQQTGKHPTPYLRNINVRWGNFDLDDIAEMDVEPHELDRVLAQQGDVIACEGGEPGRAAVWRREPIALQKALHRIRPAAGISSDYVAYGLRAAASTKQLDRLFTGTTIKHLPQEKLRQVQIALAPAAEQTRIVAAIEEAFSKLDAGEAGLRTVRRLLKRMRDAILTAAVTGRLVPQDPTDTPAPKLLADLGVPAVDTSHLPQGWASACLGDAVGRAAITDGPFGSNLKSSHYRDSGPRVIRLQNIGDGQFRDERAHIAPEHFEALVKHEVKAGDVLVASLGEQLPRACLAPEWLGAAIVKADCIRIRPGGALSGSYLMWALNSSPVRTAVSATIKGVGRPRVNLGDLRALHLPIPPAEEQARIVAMASQHVV